MSVGFHQIGDAVRLHTETYPFKSAAGTETDPTVTKFGMIEPDGTETIYTYGTDAQLTRSAAGKFSVTWTTDQPGRHEWRWWGTGAVTAADHGVFWVEGSSLAA